MSLLRDERALTLDWAGWGTPVLEEKYERHNWPLLVTTMGPSHHSQVAPPLSLPEYHVKHSLLVSL